MWSWIEYLKDPNLVVKVQRFYGIKPIEKPVSVTNANYACCKIGKCDKECSDFSLDANKLTSGLDVKTCTVRSNKIRSLKDSDDVLSSESETENKSYIITNWFWYYVFVFGTELGDEIFYATFIPFWFWNVDGAVGRRVVVVWTIIMYVGQGIKDILCWPRPSSPPVYRLQQKWSQEYGMPSTHAMVGVSIPFSVVLYTINRYQYPLFIGLLIATLWCTVMCVSRIYLGMHSVLDIVAGLLLALVMMFPLIPLVDSLDHVLLTSKWSPLVLLFISIASVVFYPKGKGEVTPTRGDTTLVISVCVGVLIGAWTNYQLGEMHAPLSSPPYNVIWPSYPMIGLTVLRTVIGMCCIIGARASCKSISYAALLYIASSTVMANPADKKSVIKEDSFTKLSDKNIKHSQKYGMDLDGISKSNANNNVKINLVIDLCRKYITYIVLGFMTLYLLPKVFRMLHIERPTFYTEI